MMKLQKQELKKKLKVLGDEGFAKILHARFTNPTEAELREFYNQEVEWATKVVSVLTQYGLEDEVYEFTHLGTFQIQALSDNKEESRIKTIFILQHDILKNIILTLDNKASDNTIPTLKVIKIGLYLLVSGAVAYTIYASVFVNIKNSDYKESTHIESNNGAIVTGQGKIDQSVNTYNQTIVYGKKSPPIDITFDNEKLRSELKKIAPYISTINYCDPLSHEANYYLRVFTRMFEEVKIKYESVLQCSVSGISGNPLQNLPSLNGVYIAVIDPEHPPKNAILFKDALVASKVKPDPKFISFDMAVSMNKGTYYASGKPKPEQNPHNDKEVFWFGFDED